MGAKPVDITGDRFGKLTAVRRDANGKWECVCDCGNTTVVSLSNLRNGSTRSCGCIRGLEKVKNLIGQRYGRLIVKEYVKGGKWLCQCDCGNTCIVSTQNLKKKNTVSCGCYKVDVARERRLSHGGSGKRLYNVWNGIKSRCTCPTNESYKYYGGRGVSICDEWLDYAAFEKWAIANGYDPDAPYGECTIDRINTDGNYEPENCRWVTNLEQQRNKGPVHRDSNRCHAVELVDDAGNVLKRYDAIVDAASDIGLHPAQISAVCNGVQKTTHGMKWRYATSEEETVA